MRDIGKDLRNLQLALWESNDKPILYISKIHGDKYIVPKKIYEEQLKELQKLGLVNDSGYIIEMSVKNLKYKDIVEMWKDENFRWVLTDEFDIYEDTNQFVTSEDSPKYDFNSITKIWREDENGNYMLIYTKEK